MDLTKEQIEGARAACKRDALIAGFAPETAAMIDAVFDLALRGLEGQWRPIDQAEKNGSNIYAWHPRYNKAYVAHWDDDRYSKRPRPYWSYEGTRTLDSRDSQPSFYLPLSALPAPPEGK